MEQLADGRDRAQTAGPRACETRLVARLHTSGLAPCSRWKLGRGAETTPSPRKAELTLPEEAGHCCHPLRRAELWPPATVIASSAHSRRRPSCGKQQRLSHRPQVSLRNPALSWRPAAPLLPTQLTTIPPSYAGLYPGKHSPDFSHSLQLPGFPLDTQSPGDGPRGHTS